MGRKSKRQLVSRIIALVFFAGVILMVSSPRVGGPVFHKNNGGEITAPTLARGVNTSSSPPIRIVIPNASQILVVNYFQACNVVWVSSEEFKHIARGVVVAWFEKGFFNNCLRIYAHKGWIVYATRICFPVRYTNLTSSGDTLIVFSTGR